MLGKIICLVMSFFVYSFVFAAETPHKPTGRKFSTPTSAEKTEQKRQKFLTYDDMNIPLGFTRIVNFFEGSEHREGQLKFLATHLWDKKNRRDPTSILTGSLALSFWYCTHHNEGECHEYLESRKPGDIDVLMKELKYFDELLTEEAVKKSACEIKERSLEKSINVEVDDDEMFDYDFIEMSKNGLGFGDVKHLIKEDKLNYTPVMTVTKLLELKESQNFESPSEKYEDDIDTLKDLAKYFQKKNDSLEHRTPSSAVQGSSVKRALF